LTHRLDITDTTPSTIPPGKTLNALQASDFGFFGATWWPSANFDELRICTYLAIWLLTWDDETDLNNGTMLNEFGAAKAYRDQTLAYVRYCLDIDCSKSSPEVTNRVILNFKPIGVAIMHAYTVEQRRTVYEQIRFLVDMSGQEQHFRLSGTIPSIEEFWRYRLGSSAVTVCIALIEFSGGEGMTLPVEFHNDVDVRSICTYTNKIISATNDLVSLKKEIKKDAIDSLVPILFFHLGDVQMAITEVIAFIATEIKNMDVAVASLSERYESTGDDLRRRVEHFVDGCKHYTTGNLTWSLASDRYGVDKVDGEIVMTL
jgi:hypothetical protein